jgi:hypothetical protein
MYALARNEAKYKERDNRTDKTQRLEFDFLAPDSVNEIMDTIHLLQKCTGQAYNRKINKQLNEQQIQEIGKKLLEEQDPLINKLEIIAEGFENSNRPIHILKVGQAYSIYKELIIYYATNQLLQLCQRNKINNWEKLQELIPLKAKRTSWQNIGGQLISATHLKSFIKSIHNNKTKSWDDVHEFYRSQSEFYSMQKFEHAFATLLEVLQIQPEAFDKKLFKSLLQQSLKTRTWMVKGIKSSRHKDYSNPFRKMVYETKKEMDSVIGKLDENNFIKSQQKEMKTYRDKLKAISLKLKL